MKLIILAIFALLLIAIGITILVGIWRTWKIQSNPLQQQFLKGKVPQNLDGFYRGTVTNIKTNWQGKKLDSTKSAGINIFRETNGNEERYPFKTYTGKGLQDNMDVFKIDYGVNSYPWWLRFILDELVETAPGKYLGKVHVQLLPGLGFSLGYFKLEK